jgi:hypothetical protein
VWADASSAAGRFRRTAAVTRIAYIGEKIQIGAVVFAGVKPFGASGHSIRGRGPDAD